MKNKQSESLEVIMTAIIKTPSNGKLSVSYKKDGQRAAVDVTNWYKSVSSNFVNMSTDQLRSLADTLLDIADIIDPNTHHVHLRNKGTIIDPIGK